MRSLLARNMLAGAIVLTLALPAWATEQAATSSKGDKVERKAVMMSRDEVKKIQEALKDKGQDPGAIDGRMGRKTHAAIRAFQKSNSLKVTGRLDDQTADKLGVAEAKTLAKKESKEEKK